jgi:mRNA-degrading endonuclease toxin of MazEF toxin-antitoxin module
VIAVEVTSTIRSIPVEVALGRREGLRRKSVANLDSVHVIPKARLEARIGVLSPKRVPEVKRALGYALDWLELKALGDES